MYYESGFSKSSHRNSYSLRTEHLKMNYFHDTSLEVIHEDKLRRISSIPNNSLLPNVYVHH